MFEALRGFDDDDLVAAAPDMPELLRDTRRPLSVVSTILFFIRPGVLPTTRDTFSMPAWGGAPGVPLDC